MPESDARSVIADVTRENSSLTTTTTTRPLTLANDWENGGKRVWRWVKREIIHLSLHCHHQNDFCVKMGSDESHLNVSLTVKDTVTN